MTKAAWAGIDVGAKRLAVAVEDARGARVEFEVDNTPTGHRAIGRALRKAGRTSQVCLEATGVYHLDLTYALHAMTGVAIMVVNPRRAKDFARATMRRAKTDRVDARVLLEFCQRMAFQAWAPPPPAVRGVQALTRRIQALARMRVQEKNRRHAAAASAGLPAALAAASQAHIAFLEAQIRELTTAATALVATAPTLQRQLEQLQSVPGIARRSGLRLLGELAGLPADMTARQWVAHAGLDPRPCESGTSVHKSPRISRTGNAQLRGALYMPALVAVRRDPAARAFYDRLQTRQQKKLQGIVAVMRKLLHAIYGMFRHDQTYDASKCYAPAAA